MVATYRKAHLKQDGRSSLTVIDWVKATALIDAQKCDDLLNALDFRCRINEFTGELEEWPKRYSYANLDFVMIPAVKKPGYWLEVTGSLHRLWEGKTNWQSFGFKDLVFTIKFLSFICQIAPSSFTISQLEFGVNLMGLGDNAQNILNNLIGYKHTTFNQMRTRRCKHIGYSASLIDYQIKLYDKAAQFSLPQPIIRVEIHVNQHVNRMLGIKTLECLTEMKNIITLGDILCFKVKQIIFDDPNISEINLRQSQIDCLQKGRNPRYYSHFSVEERKKLKKIIDLHGISRYSELLSQTVTRTWFAYSQR